MQRHHFQLSLYNSINNHARDFISTVGQGNAMATWAPAQQRRLASEKQILEKSFHSVKWHDPQRKGATKVDVALATNAGGRYTLRINIPTDFPSSCPELLLVSASKPIRKRNGEPLPEVSNEYHTLGKTDGCYVLCHFRSKNWDANNTLYLVFLKGRLWLEAFENHLKTGYALDHYLKHME